MKVIAARNGAKYDKKVEANRQWKIKEQQLDTIAELHLRGLTQKQIAERIGTTQQTICNRLATIRAEYEELLQEKQVKQTKQDYDNDNGNDNEDKSKLCSHSEQTLPWGVCAQSAQTPHTLLSEREKKEKMKKELGF